MNDIMRIVIVGRLIGRNRGQGMGQLEHRLTRVQAHYKKMVNDQMETELTKRIKAFTPDDLDQIFTVKKMDIPHQDEVRQLIDELLARP